MKICGLSYIDEYEGLVLKRIWIYLFIIVLKYIFEHALTNNITKFE